MSKRNKARQQKQSPQEQKNNAAIGTFVTRGREYFANKDPNRGIQMFQQALKLAPKHAKLHLELGSKLLKINRVPKGMEYLEKALEIDPDLVPALIELSQAHSKKGELDDAKPLIERALELDDQQPGAHLVCGTIQQKNGELTDAVDHFRQALQLRINRVHKQKTAVVGRKTDKLAQPPKPAAKKKDFDKPETEALLWETLHVLAKSNVHAFACYGTLLGLTRDDGLIPFDKDLDMGIPYSEMDRAARCLENNGWVEVDNPFLTNPRAFMNPTRGVSLDMSGFVIDPDNGQTYTGFWQTHIPHEWNRTTQYPPVELKKDTAPTGESIWTLTDPVAWMKAIYGNGWEIPDSTFDTVIAANNLCGFAPMTQCYALSRIYSRWESGQIPKALATARHAQKHRPDDALLEEVAVHLETLMPSHEKMAAHEYTALDHLATLEPGAVNMNYEFMDDADSDKSEEAASAANDQH